MGKEELKFDDDKLFVCTPLPQYGDGICKTQLVMTKEIFQACYKRWIEQEPKQGHWIPTEYDSYADGNPVWDIWECSECGYEHNGEEDTLTAYCPDCGAKMIEPQESEDKE